MYLYDDTHKYFEFPLLFWKAIKETINHHHQTNIITSQEIG